MIYYKMLYDFYKKALKNLFKYNKIKTKERVDKMTKTKKILITLIFLTIFILLGSNRCNASGDLYLKNLDFQAKINQSGFRADLVLSPS